MSTLSAMDSEIKPLLEDFEETEEKTDLGRFPLLNSTSDAQTSFDVISELPDENSSPQEKDNEYYDIFISHASDDIEEVKVLCTELENKYNLKCMLADRDFEIGVPIDKNLKSKMERSKRILLIITPSFVESFWCKEEIMRAIKIMSSGNSNLMIPVLLKPVETEMPSFLEFYTYINATKEDDLSLKIFETFHNPKIVDGKDKIRQKVFPLTPEQIRNQNGARLMSRLCKKANTSCRGVAWSFPPIDDMAYEQEDILQIYNEVKDILNDSFAFRWYGIMFNKRRQVIIGIITFIISLFVLPVILDMSVLIAGRVHNFPVGPWFITVYFAFASFSTIILLIGVNVIGKKSFAAVERKVFDYCLKERRGSSVIAFVKNTRRNARWLARPPSLVLVRYNLKECENFVFEFLKLKEQSTRLLTKELVNRRVQEFTFIIRQALVHWDDMPNTERNRHNTWLQKQCICEYYVSIHTQKEEAKP